MECCTCQYINIHTYTYVHKPRYLLMHKPCLGAKQDIKSFCNHVCTPRRAPQIDGQEKLTGNGKEKKTGPCSGTTVSKESELYIVIPVRMEVS